jgi:hypothetical protein
MGLLGYSAHLHSLSNPNHLFPPSQTGHRILQIQTPKSRFPRRFHISRLKRIHPRANLSRRRRVRLELCSRNFHAHRRRRLSYRLYCRGTEICNPAYGPVAFAESSEFGIVDLCFVYLRDLLLYEFVFPSDLFSGCDESAGRCALKCWSPPGPLAPSNRNDSICWHCRSKVFPPSLSFPNFPLSISLF